MTKIQRCDLGIKPKSYLKKKLKSQIENSCAENFDISLLKVTFHSLKKIEKEL